MASQGELKVLMEELARKDAEINDLIQQLGAVPGRESWLWICDACYSQNIEGDEPLTHCEFCYADKPASNSANTQRPVPGQFVPPTPVKVRTPGKPDQPTWRCSACTSANDEPSLVCEICHADRYENADETQSTFSTLYEVTNRSTSSTFVNKLNQTDRANWICSACMSINDDINGNACSTCYADRSDEVNWTCSACMSVNDDINGKVCSICYADRSDEVNWTCSACMSVNDDINGKVCSTCYADRKSIEPESAVPSVATSVHNQHWVCRSCMSKNSPSDIVCYMCYDEKTWSCPQCRKENSTDTPQCTDCHYTNVISLDISGVREMLDAARTRELLQLPRDPERITSITLKTKSFGTQAATVAADVLRALPNLEVVDFSDIIAGRPTDEALGVLKTMCEALPLHKVKVLDLSDNALGERGIRVLEHTLKTVSPNIEQLIFRNNGLSAKSIELFQEYIGTPSKLQGLHFYSNMSGSGGAQALQPLFQRLSQFPDLPFEFTMSSCRVQPDGVEALGTGLNFIAKRLTALDLSDSTMGNEGSLAVANMLENAINLKKLVIADPGSRGDPLKRLISAVGALANLEYLDLSGAELGSKNMKALISTIQSNCTKLNFLKLSENEATGSGFEELLNNKDVLRELEHLHIQQNDLNEVDIQRLALLMTDRENLKTIEFGEDDLDKDAVDSVREILGDRFRFKRSDD